MSKLYTTSGVGSAQTLSDAQDSKEKVYADLASAEADIANIAEGEFIDTLDEEVVKEDEIVTKSDFPKMLVPDYANPLLTGLPANGWTATEDCFITINKLITDSSSNLHNIYIKIDNENVAISVSSGSGGIRVTSCSFSGYVKKGQTVVSVVDSVSEASATFRAYPLA